MRFANNFFVKSFFYDLNEEITKPLFNHKNTANMGFKP